MLLPQSEYELRDYQQGAVDKLRDSFRAGNRRPLLQASTGAGKTMIAVDIIKSALDKGKRVMFVIDRLTLVDQTSVVFDKFGLDHGIEQGDHWRRNNNLLLQLVSVQTLVRRKLMIKPDLMIVDEAHSIYSSFIDLIQGAWSDVPIVALSATPWTKGLGKIYDDLIVVENTQNLIDKGHLSDFVCYGPSSPDLKGIKMSGGDYNQKELGERANKPEIVGSVVDTWLRLGDDRQTICFAVNIAHSKAIVDEFLANGVTAAHIDAFTDKGDRNKVLKKHEEGEIKIVSNCQILTKGFDSPNSTCLIYARPTKSLMLHIQCIGRVLRKADSGKQAIILDHGKSIERLGFPTDQLPEYLCNGDKDESKQSKKEVEEKLPTACEKCSYLSKAYKCPSCGHEPERMPNVLAKSGELKKLSKADASEKVKWLGMLLGYAREHKFKDGWASHKYREKFGVWPARKVGINAVSPDEEVRKFIQHLNIKQHYSKKKTTASSFHPAPQDVQEFKDGRKMIRVTKGGEYQGYATQTDAMKQLVGL